MTSINQIKVDVEPLRQDCSVITDETLRERFKMIHIRMERKYYQMNKVGHRGPQVIHPVHPYCSCSKCWTCTKCGLHLKDTTSCEQAQEQLEGLKEERMIPLRRQYAIAFAEPVSAEKRA